MEKSVLVNAITFEACIPSIGNQGCDPTIFPNISVLLQIACTLPVTSCECERSASALRRLNKYMQASMGKGAFRTLHYSIFTTIRQWTLTEW